MLSSRLRLRAPTGSCSLSFYDVSVERSWKVGNAKLQLEATLDAKGSPRLVASASGLRWEACPWASLAVALTRTSTTTSIATQLVFRPTAVIDEKDLRLSLIVRPHVDGVAPPYGISKAVMTVRVSDWSADVTVYPHEADWLDGLFFLECKARGSLRLGAAGSVTIDLLSLWTTTVPGRLDLSLAYKPRTGRTFAFEWGLDLPNRSLDTLSFQFQSAWR